MFFVVNFWCDVFILAIAIFKGLESKERFAFG